MNVGYTSPLHRKHLKNVNHENTHQELSHRNTLYLTTDRYSYIGSESSLYGSQFFVESLVNLGMPEKEEIRLRKLFRETKTVFAGDLGDPAFLVFYHEDIVNLCHEYGVTLCIHKPKFEGGEQC